MDTRPLPTGWVSQWEPSAGRYFFVDTTKNPPVSTWNDPRESNSDATPPPPPYSPSDESANKTTSPMPMAMPSADSYQNTTYNNNYSATSTYPPSDSKYSPQLQQGSYQGDYPGQPQKGYPGQPQQGYPGQPQPDSYTPYNKYDGAATASTSSTSDTKQKKGGGLLGKFGLKPGKNNKIPGGPAAALGTAATLGALSHNKPFKPGKHGKLLGGGVLGAATGLYLGHSLTKGFGFKGGFKGGCGDWGGGGDWGGCDW